MTSTHPEHQHPDPDPERPIQLQWHGALADPAALSKDAVQTGALTRRRRPRRELGDPPRLLDSDDSPWDVNAWRPGGTARFTPLHQAAWHGAPPDVIDQLLIRGARLTQRTADDQTAHDIAASRGHHHLANTLQPRPDRRLSLDRARILDRHLAALVESRIRPHLTIRLTHPQTIVLTEMPEHATLWYPIPGMYGGFSIQLMRGYLYTESWSRVVGGSGQAHVITTDGATLVDEGFA